MALTLTEKLLVSSVFALAASMPAMSTPARSQDKQSAVGWSEYGHLPSMKLARLRNCSVIPTSEKSFLTNEWEVDCFSRFTESGHFLVKQLLRRETEKALGIPQPVEIRNPNRNAFSYVG